tara:strand:- start:117 stop:314 length:198 start_codon:yes stop_codon:yes gene_type:complete
MSSASPEEKEKFQFEMAIVCFVFLAIIALVVQLISGFMVVWTVIGSVALFLTLFLAGMLRTFRKN